ncbi:hypothetical protein C8A01DRAFT_31727 [Parachaetomium inaequale]|uniref:Uncharacterized protein n=1 Tax=Parachaetomium inaequale TaxID=2588326 RepID=A0AAN6PT71_9PEZI|nr:hypothetical protein C8A01DRAFT_31727 [Parachaetomium inaequale]
MATTPTIGHKRTHSDMESEAAPPETTAPKQSPQSPPRVLLLHLSALLSCKQAIIHTVRAIVPHVLPDNDIPVFTDEDVLRAFSKTPIVNKLMCELAKRNLTPEENARLVERYPRIYYQVGVPLLTLAPHAKELLEAVKRRGDIALAVVSSNPDKAVPTLITLGVGHLVDTVLKSLPAKAYSSEEDRALAPKLFHDNWQHEVVPWFTKRSRAAAMTTTNNNGPPTIIIDDDDNDDTPEINIKPLLPAQALLVSCCIYDLCVAKASGTQTCWIRKIDAGDEAAMRVSGMFDIVVEELDALRVKLFGEGVVHVGDKDNNKNEGEGGKDENKREEGDKDNGECDKSKSEGDKNKGVGHMEKIKEEGEDLVMGGVEKVGGVDQQEGAVAKSPAEAGGKNQVMKGAGQEEGSVDGASGEADHQASKAPDANGDQVTKAVDAGGDQVMQTAQDDEVDMVKVEVLE